MTNKLKAQLRRQHRQNLKLWHSPHEQGSWACWVWCRQHQALFNPVRIA